MRILVGTSVWADFLNGFPSAEERTLARLIAGEDEVCACGVIVSEVFQGLRREKGRVGLASLFRELEFLEPAGVDSYFRAAEVYRALRRKGITVRSTTDCLIAAVAEERNCEVLTRDRDLNAILASGLVKTRALKAQR